MAEKEQPTSTFPSEGDPRNGVPTKTQKDAHSSDEQPEVMESAMRKMAASSGFQEITAMMGTMGPMGHPLHQKMTEQHITKMLDLAVQHDTNEFTLRTTQQSIDSKNEHEHRIAQMIGLCLLVGLLIVILILFRDQPNVLIPILTGAGGFIGGAAGGFGYGKSRSSGSGGDKE